MELFDKAHIDQIQLPAHNRNGQDEVWQENKLHFLSQTEIVKKHLDRGETVTGKMMYDEYQIQDIRPRIAAIKKSLIGTEYKLVESRIPGAHGAKQWKRELKTEQDKEAEALLLSKVKEAA